MDKLFAVPSGQDTIYDEAQQISDFRFDARTAAVFPDMIHRSIPGYATLLQLISVIGQKQLSDHALVYDLGCSLGGVSLSLRQVLPDTVHIRAVDISPAMVQRLQQYVEGMALSNIEVIESDILTLDYQPCQMVVLNFVMQFLSPDKRLFLLEKIYHALADDGVLIVSEKVLPKEDIIRVWHERFKATQGYSEMAIAQKREALENVMRTDPKSVIEARFYQVGFAQVLPIFQGFSFHSWAIFKQEVA